ncbi:hypothetical protein ACP70R_020475 [Stipagrostis hirtigluma subsp. patula]
MGKRGIVSIFSRLVDAPSPGAGGGASGSPPWPWPSCGSNPQTTSFRADEKPCCTMAGGPGPAAATAKLRGAAAGEMYKTVNSVYFDSADDDFSLDCEGAEQRQKEDLELDDDDGFSTTTASEEWSEAVIRSLGRTSTDRFFVDPGPASKSILAAAASSPERMQPPEAKAAPAPDPDPENDDDDGKEVCVSTSPLAEGSVAVAVDSEDPYRDFRASMEEMVAAHGLRDWAALEELLAWYLRINGKHNHALIVGAFVDLLLGLASPSPSATAATTTTTTTSSAATSSSASASSSTTSTTSITATTTATGTTATMEQCGHGNEAAACSSSSSCGTSSEQDVAEEKASTTSDNHVIHESGSTTATLVP